MRKYLIFLYLLLILFFIFSCSKKKDKIINKSDTYLSNTRYDLIGSFNFKDKILGKVIFTQWNGADHDSMVFGFFNNYK